eukprot:917013-Rhodomonas_salina.1
MLRKRLIRAERAGDPPRDPRDDAAQRPRRHPGSPRTAPVVSSECSRTVFDFALSGADAVCGCAHVCGVARGAREHAGGALGHPRTHCRGTLLLPTSHLTYLPLSPI